MLQWQTVICVAGQQLTCLESYDSVHERIRDGHMRQSEGGSIHGLAPLELTIYGVDGQPLRALVQPQAIAYVMELPESDRVEVGERA